MARKKSKDRVVGTGEPEDEVQFRVSITERLGSSMRQLISSGIGEAPPGTLHR